MLKYCLIAGHEELENIRYVSETLQPETFYVMEDDTTFYSVDGEGGFFYDTLDEALENH